MHGLNTSKGIGGTKKRAPHIVPLLLLLFAAPPRIARAQGEASINGAVTDTTGAIIAGATVKVKNVEVGTIRAIVTDTTGRYDAASLAVGKYEVSAEQAGFRTEVKTGITLAIGQRAEVNLMLAVGGMQQSISVEETALQLAVTTADFSGLVGETQVKELPLNGRSYDQLLTLNPGVVNYTSQCAGGIGTSNSVVGNMFSASGRRPQENLYILNGVEFTSASEVNYTPGGTSGQLLGVDAVREFSGRWWNTPIGNWQLSGIETLVSGLPFTPQFSYNPSNDGDSRNPVRPSLNPAFTGSIIQGGPGQHFNPNAFIQPLANTYGNAPRNFLQGPGLATTDFSVSKKFLSTERVNLQFRTELFNIFNRTNFNNPNPVVFTSATTVLPSATAGVITSTSTTSRQVQFGLKLPW